MGAQWLRFDVKWDVIQYGGAASYDFSRYDALVAAAQARGLKVLGTLAYARWARSSACADSTACEPRNADEYAAWAGATVRTSRAGSRTKSGTSRTSPTSGSPSRTSRGTRRCFAPRIRRSRRRILRRSCSPGNLAGRKRRRPHRRGLVPTGRLREGDRAFRRVEHHPYTHRGRPATSTRTAPGTRCTARPRACAA